MGPCGSLPRGLGCVLAVGLFFVFFACTKTRTQEYEIGQKIDMGPYTFTVKWAKEGWWHVGPPRRHIKQIEVYFRLHRDDSAPFTSCFTSYLFDMEIEDLAGNRFISPGGPVPLSPYTKAGRIRSETGEYNAVFTLDPDKSTVRDREHIGQHPQDFKLIIKNPDPKADEPHRISVQLK